MDHGEDKRRRDLFEAAGLPALQPDPRPDRRGTRLEREFIRPLEEATVGHRNVSLFESLRRLADVTNRPHGLDGRITLKRWYSVVLDLALGLLDRMPRPRLPVGEVRVIAYHVGSWSGSGHPRSGTTRQHVRPPGDVSEDAPVVGAAGLACR